MATSWTTQKVANHSSNQPDAATAASPSKMHSTPEFGVTDAQLRAELVASHLAGLAFARYQLKIEPIASTGVDELVAWLGPTVQRYLTAPIP
ncbi:hypothetical protein LAUMK35_00479 [Mycobacterium pseudokansasii]|uniref:Tetracyclin repressor-like C-terminal domain-containing protein n=2 Tax=Mycobacterium pseudokansasii TaxID=2341080 RepID=A0A498QGX7_9MYCO|nr:hypothetical protein LAUMK35_00479 [Mycobacterium pseudokansasii]VAZ88709.1 hypothetical protein LAUMK21_00479 [Mycobacterium pseudokansasii]VBA46436.1 hypothetical protein LAUMK142_00333 [Mycobacterium pseudokansasii]